MGKRIAWALLVLLCAAQLSGCGRSPESSGEITAVALPRPDDSYLSGPVGDQTAPYSFSATLNYCSQDGQLVSTLRLIRVQAEEEPYVKLLSALLERPYLSSGLQNIAPEGTRLLSARLNNGIMTVDLSAEAYSEGEEKLCLARAAIASTLLSLKAVHAVNLLVEGQALELGGLPLGLVTAENLSEQTFYSQFLSEQLMAQNGGQTQRFMPLYRLCPEDNLLLPEAVSVAVDLSDPCDSFLDAYWAAASPSLPYDQELLEGISASVTLTASGEKIFSLYLPADFANTDITEKLIPSLFLSACGFLPGVNGCRAYIATQAVDMAGGLQADASGSFDPKLLLSLSGTSATMCFVLPQGTLGTTSRRIAIAQADARGLLSELMTPPEGWSSVFPEGSAPEDVIGIRTENGIAHLNLSAKLYDACQAFSPQEERNFVYGIVNTLVENLHPVSRVLFYVEGERCETLAGNLSILTPLMANPGAYGGK